MSKRPPIINLDELTYESQRHGEAFEARFAAIANPLGARKLGYRITIVPPGKRAWPYHAHHVNEEMFLILEGEGTLRLADEEFPVRAGDVIAIPPSPDTPHQIVNTGSQDIKYLCVSTMEEPDVVEYPDSDKRAVIAGSAPGGNKVSRTLAMVVRRDAEVDYWEGE